MWCTWRTRWTPWRVGAFVSMNSSALKIASTATVICPKLLAKGHILQHVSTADLGAISVSSSPARPAVGLETIHPFRALSMAQHTLERISLQVRGPTTHYPPPAAVLEVIHAQLRVRDLEKRIVPQHPCDILRKISPHPADLEIIHSELRAKDLEKCAGIIDGFRKIKQARLAGDGGRGWDGVRFVGGGEVVAGGAGAPPPQLRVQSAQPRVYI